MHIINIYYHRYYTHTINSILLWGARHYVMFFPWRISFNSLNNPVRYESPLKDEAPWEVTFTCPKHIVTIKSKYYTMLFSRKWVWGQTFQRTKILLDIIIYTYSCQTADIFLKSYHIPISDLHMIIFWRFLNVKVTSTLSYRKSH